MPGSKPRSEERSAGTRPGACGGYSLRRSGRSTEAAISSPWCRICWGADFDAYQATVLSRPTRTMTARARDNTIAQVSVEKERRVRGVDMEKSPWKKRGTRKKNTCELRQ